MTSLKTKLVRGLTYDTVDITLKGRNGKVATKASFDLDQLDIIRRLRIRMKKLFIKKTNIIQEKNYNKFIFGDMDTYEKVSEDFNIDWYERKKKIMKTFKVSTVSIQQNSPMVQYFHVDKYTSDRDSVGSISCDDDIGDMEILLSGEQ